MTEFQVRVRSYLFRVVVLVAFIILTLQLWSLQIVQGETYRELADANRFRLTQVPASRGVIYDRTGELLVRNRPVYNVIVIPAFLPENATAEAQIFARLSELLDLPITTQLEPVTGLNNGYFHAISHHQFRRQLKRQIINPRSRQFVNKPLGIRDAVNQNRTFAPFLPVTIATDVEPMVAMELEEERLDLPGVLVDISPSREYLYGDLFSHMLGYTGPIPAEQFERYSTLGYDLVDKIGLAGLEFEYEDWLRGIKGLENIEVDVTGQKIRTVSEDVEARPGHNLRLTLDLELQAATAEALQEVMDEVDSGQGVAIAMNPQNGEILAMVSLPSFDNNLFSKGISPRELSLLSEDPWNPLVDHAIAGLYPPGSTFKIIPATGGLQEGVVSQDTTLVDEGVLYLPNRFEPDNLDLAQPFYGWLRTGLGEVNIISALAWSSNIYFYQVGGGYEPTEFVGLGLERVGKYAEMFGFGQQTGIDLPGELAGLVPSAKWKRINYSETWLTGDTYNLSIGQGFILITPLQLLNAYAAIANGGTLYRPHLVKEILDADGNLVKVIEPEVIGQLEVDPQHVALIRAGLHGVINWENGTARENFDVPGLDASGKTGTAEFCDEYPECLDRDGRVKTSHGWFASYAPTNNPEIVTLVFVYGGGEGSAVSVPVTNKILRQYFNLTDPEDGDDSQRLADSEPEPQPERRFTARLLGTDSWSRAGLSLLGFVFDERGQALGEIPVEIVAGDEVMAQLISDDRGRFEFEAVEVSPEARLWQVRLADRPDSPVLELDVANGLRYLIEFEAELDQAQAPVSEIE
jgi:penicillin-binding protein 2